MANITYCGPGPAGTWTTYKGSPLTILQVDSNFWELNSKKLEKDSYLDEIRLAGANAQSTARSNLGLLGLPAITSPGTSSQYLCGDGAWRSITIPSNYVTSVSGSGTVSGISLSGTVTSSGSLTLSGTLSVNLSSDVSGTLPVSRGGTGISTITNQAVVFGNGTAYGFVGPGVNGDVLTTGTSGSPGWSAASSLTVGTCSGNAATATNLLTARSINGTSFNGSADITTANWGTSRTITIGNTGKSVNGSGDVSWSLTEIGAATSSHSHNYLPTTGGTISGTLDVGGLFRISAQNGSEGGELWLAKPASGTSLAGSVVFDVLGDSIRIFENGGNYRGLTCNLTGCATNQSTIIHSDNVGSYAIPRSGGSITGNLSVSGTLSAGTFSPSSISTGNITATSLSCTGGNISTNSNMYIGPGAGPAFPLHVDKNIAWSGSWVGFDQNGGLYGPSTGTIYISIRASSDIAGGRIFAISDIRKKENINQIDSGLDFVKNVKPVTFTWKTTNQFDSGFIAQDLLKTKYNYLVNMIPDEVEEYVDDEIKIPAGTSCLVNYNSIVPILTKAIQEQQEIINNLKARIEALEAK